MIVPPFHNGLVVFLFSRRHFPFLLGAAAFAMLVLMIEFVLKF